MTTTCRHYLLYTIRSNFARVRFWHGGSLAFVARPRRRAAAHSEREKKGDAKTWRTERLDAAPQTRKRRAHRTRLRGRLEFLLRLRGPRLDMMTSPFAMGQAALGYILRASSPMEFLIRLRGLRLGRMRQITSPFAMGRAALEYIIRVRRPLEFLLRLRGLRLDMMSKVASTFPMGRAALEYILRPRRPLEFLIRLRGLRLAMMSNITITIAMWRTSNSGSLG